ncbi:MAG: phosphoribosylaminoimidazolesuccinocarboxamide synthase, partial [Planctomycetota bacterium]
MPTVTQSEVPGVEPSYRGKVRDIYELEDRLLLVATDRISAFDVILPQAV